MVCAATSVRYSRSCIRHTRRLVAGTVVHGSALEQEILAVGAETQLARMAKLVAQAQGSKAPAQDLADRISAVFVPAILALALAVSAAAQPAPFTVGPVTAAPGTIVSGTLVIAARAGDEGTTIPMTERA